MTNPGRGNNDRTEHPVKFSKRSLPARRTSHRTPVPRGGPGRGERGFHTANSRWLSSAFLLCKTQTNTEQTGARLRRRPAGWTPRSRRAVACRRSHAARAHVQSPDALMTEHVTVLPTPVPALAGSPLGFPASPSPEARPLLRVRGPSRGVPSSPQQHCVPVSEALRTRPSLPDH